MPELLLALRRHAPELGAVHRGTALHRLAKAECRRQGPRERYKQETETGALRPLQLLEGPEEGFPSSPVTPSASSIVVGHLIEEPAQT